MRRLKEIPVSEQAKKLRAILNGRKPLVSMGVWDPYSAMVAEQEGFETLTIFGSMVSWSLLGMTDTGYMTQTEVIDVARRIIARVSVPVIVDCDDGFGDPINVRRTVQLVEQVGAAGLYIEDLSRPLRCSALGGGGLVPVEVMVQKIRAAVEARVNPDFFLMARTDAYVPVNEIAARAKRYVEAGVDMVLVIGLDKADDLRAVAQKAGVPLATIQAARTKHAFLAHKSLVDMGYKGMFHVQPMYLAAAHAMRESARMLRADIDKGTDVPRVLPGPSPVEIETTIGLKLDDEMNTRYFAKP
jgi:2-methylisocitrate lyase-like PEP mutase family enzyme